jgi:hypothetical protein
MEAARNFPTKPASTASEGGVFHFADQVWREFQILPLTSDNLLHANAGYGSKCDDQQPPCNVSHLNKSGILSPHPRANIVRSFIPNGGDFGTLEELRTPDAQIRSLVLEVQ